MWKKKKENEINELITVGLNHYWQRVHSKRIIQLNDEFNEWKIGNVAILDGKKSGVDHSLLEFLLHKIKQQLQTIFDFQRKHEKFARRFRSMSQKGDQYSLMEVYLLKPHLNIRENCRSSLGKWSGFDSVQDRFIRTVNTIEFKIMFYLERLGKISSLVIERYGPTIGYLELWKKIDLEKILTPILHYEGDSRVNIECFRCITTAVKALPDEYHKESLSETTIQFIYYSAMESKCHQWIQIEALSLLKTLSLDSFTKAVTQRLWDITDPDDFFVRRRALLQAGEVIDKIPAFKRFMSHVMKDPSPYMRQSIPKILGNFADEDLLFYLKKLVLRDSSIEVQASAILEIESFVERDSLFDDLLQLLGKVLAKEKDMFVLRVALLCAVKVLEKLKEQQNSQRIQTWFEGLIPAIEGLHVESPIIPVKRWAAQTREKMWVLFDDKAYELKSILQKELHRMKPAKRKKVSSFIWSDYDEDLLGRVLAEMSQADFGYYLEKKWFGLYITRGHIMRFRTWRFWQEFRTPSPDKRQAFNHTIGRHLRGTIHAPSYIMGELTETKVPGEPLILSEELGWRPFIPLLDEINSSMDYIFQPKDVKVFTSEGITAISPPKELRDRFKAKVNIALNFIKIARMRNWKADSQSDPAAYIKYFADLGFNITFKGYPKLSELPSTDEGVAKFFQL